MTATKTDQLAKIKLGLKLGLVALLFYFLAKRGLLSLEATRQALSRTELILPALAALIVAQFLGVVRWQWLLRAQDYELSWWTTFQLTYIGAFFNLALPGAVSGDLVKAYYVAQETKGRKGRVFGTILFDRVAGVSALVLVSAGALAWNLGHYIQTPLFQGIQWIMTCAAAGVIAFYSYLFLVREKHDLFLRALYGFQRRVPRAASLTRIYLGLRHYHSEKAAVLKVLAISILVHCLVSFASYSFALALGAENIALLSVFVVVPLGLLVTAVPVTPGGVGTGHAAFGWFFLFLGTERGADVFSLHLMGQILGAVIGGVIYLRYRAKAASKGLLPVHQSDALS